MDELTGIKAKCFDLLTKNEGLNIEITNFVIKLGKILEVDFTPSITLDAVLEAIEAKYKHK